MGTKRLTAAKVNAIFDAGERVLHSLSDLNREMESVKREEWYGTEKERAAVMRKLIRMEEEFAALGDRVHKLATGQTPYG